MHRIEAELLIPGRGEPVRDGVVVLDGARIGYAGPAATAPAPGAAVCAAAAVMPGMWDCHGHFFGTRTFDLDSLVLEPLPLRGARSARDLRAALDAGHYLGTRGGGLGIDLARAVDEGVLDGPAINAAGAILSTTGGHGDLHSYPLDWMEHLRRQAGTMRLADGPDDCARAVREQLRRNARLIKVCASGGVLSEVDDPIRQQFTLAELRAIVEIAGMADRVVAAHCHGKPGDHGRAGGRGTHHRARHRPLDECSDVCGRAARSWSRPGRSSSRSAPWRSRAQVPDYAVAKTGGDRRHPRAGRGAAPTSRGCGIAGGHRTSA